ncbi:MAG: hypothetical protein MK135_15240, partial [Polyangiaceae bacterium]|nr:hypothetical protein [Polyangiaceae bacterium]
MSSGDDLSLHEELAAIAASLQAYVEWHDDCGTTGLPRDPQLKEKLAALPQLSAPAPRSTQRLAQTTASNEDRFETPDAIGTSSEEEAFAAFHEPSPWAEEAAASRRAKAPVEQRLATPPTASAPSSSRPKGPTSAQAPSAKQKKPRTQPTTAAADEKKEPDLPPLLRNALSEHHPSQHPLYFTRGQNRAGLLFLAEWGHDEKQSLASPLDDEAGQLLDKMIRAMGLEVDEVGLSTFIKSEPSSERLSSSAETTPGPPPPRLSQCLPLFQEDISRQRPQVIVTLGAN